MLTKAGAKLLDFGLKLRAGMPRQIVGVLAPSFQFDHAAGIDPRRAAAGITSLKC
jgi:hypothetical protein